MSGGGRIGLYVLVPETKHWLGRALWDGGFPHAALACELFERGNWCNGRGDVCTASMRKSLPQLQSGWG